MRELEQRLEQRKVELQDLDRQESEAEGRLVDLKHSLETYNAKVKENVHKVKHFQNEVMTLLVVFRDGCFCTDSTAVDPSVPLNVVFINVVVITPSVEGQFSNRFVAIFRLKSWTLVEMKGNS